MENEKKLFIASSSMYLNYAYALKDSLNESLQSFSLKVRCALWKDDDVFLPGHSVWETLVKLNPAYAIALVTPDDKAQIKGSDYVIARDNVIFEYGLFVGKLGRDKTFFVAPDNEPNLQVMSDLSGVVPIPYPFSPGADVRQAKRDLVDAVHRISQRIHRLETPPSHTPSHSPSSHTAPRNTKKAGRNKPIFPPM